MPCRQRHAVPPCVAPIAVNAPPRENLRQLVGTVDVAILVDTFPEASQTFVGAEAAALARLGHRVTVEARGRAEPPGTAPPGIAVHHADDEPAAARLAALAWLAARHPRRCWADWRGR